MTEAGCSYFQKQPSKSVLRKRCSENMQQTYRRTLMLKCDFKATFLNHTSAGVFSCNLLHIFRTPFSKNTSGWLLLYFQHSFRSSRRKNYVRKNTEQLFRRTSVSRCFWMLFFSRYYRVWLFFFKKNSYWLF